MNLETVSNSPERPEATSNQASDLTEPAANSHSRFLSFTIGGGKYCLPADAVVEVSHPLDLARLPKSPANVLGVASFTGEIALVVDLRSLLSESRPAADTKAKMLRLAVIGDETNIAFPVDAVGEVFSSEPSSFITAGGAPLVEGTQHGALPHPVSLLSPTAIRAISDPRSA